MAVTRRRGALIGGLRVGRGLARRAFVVFLSLAILIGGLATPEVGRRQEEGSRAKEGEGSGAEAAVGGAGKGAAAGKPGGSSELEPPLQAEALRPPVVAAEGSRSSKDAADGSPVKKQEAAAVGSAQAAKLEAAAAAAEEDADKTLPPVGGGTAAAAAAAAGAAIEEEEAAPPASSSSSATTAAGPSSSSSPPWEVLMARVEELEKKYGEALLQNNNRSGGVSLDSLDDENKSLLDIVSDSVFHYVTTRMTPATDKECFWSYSIGKCLPRCKCKYQFQFGDYSLGRSCRLNRNASEVALCDPQARDQTDDPILLKARRWTLHGLTALRQWLELHAPPTDTECDWSWQTLHCEPRPKCKFFFQLGDFHIGRSCRLKRKHQQQPPSRRRDDDEEDEDNEDEEDERVPEEGEEEEEEEEPEEEEEGEEVEEEEEEGRGPGLREEL